MSRVAVGSPEAERVDDESTAKLMAAYYERLLERDGRNEARALLGARKALRKTHPDPYHWGRSCSWVIRGRRDSLATDR